MRNIIFIQNNTAFIIFTISFILILLITNIQSRQSKRESQNSEITQSKIIDELDSVKTVQNKIAYYDSVNLLNEKIRLLDTIFSDVNAPTKSVDSENLIAILDSIDINIIALKEQKNKYIKSFDSLSPSYPFVFRDSIRLEFNTLNSSLIVVMDDNIDRFDSELLLIKLMKYLMSSLFIILFPIRWILQWFYKNKNVT